VVCAAQPDITLPIINTINIRIYLDTSYCAIPEVGSNS